MRSGVDDLTLQQLLGSEHTRVFLQLRQHGRGRLAVDWNACRRVAPRLPQRARRVGLDAHLVDVLHVGCPVPARQVFME